MSKKFYCRVCRTTYHEIDQASNGMCWKCDSRHHDDMVDAELEANNAELQASDDADVRDDNE